MTEEIDNLVEQFESQRIFRRQLVASLSAIVAYAARTSAQAPAAGPCRCSRRAAPSITRRWR